MTLAELKRRHESGEKQQKRVQAQIKDQLKRECAMRGCHESLAFATSKRLLCDSHRGRTLAKAPVTSKKGPVKRITKAELRKLNREKKKRYYEKHGIKFDKTVRNRDAQPLRQALEKGTAQVWDGTPLLYENYKEPLKPIEKNKGHGYYGTVATTDDYKYVQCHVCGNLYENLGGHLRKHKLTGEKYKEMYQLKASVALLGEEARKKKQEQAVKKISIAKPGELPIWLQEYNKKVQSGAIKHPGTKRKEGGMSLQKRNELGLCPDQVLEKIRELADKLGRTPGYNEFRDHYEYKYLASIKFQHGSWANAVRKLGMKTAAELRKPDREALLGELLDFQAQHGRIPMTSDFNRGLLRDKAVYIRKFGSLNNARVEAGMNAVLPMPFGQVIEMTPEQYTRYKNGDPLKELFTDGHSGVRRKRQYKRGFKAKVQALEQEIAYGQ